MKIFFSIVIILIVILRISKKNAKVRTQKHNEYKAMYNVQQYSLSCRYKEGIKNIDKLVDRRYGNFIRQMFDNYDYNEYLGKRINENMATYYSDLSKIEKYMEQDNFPNGMESLRQRYIAVDEFEKGIIQFYIWVKDNTLFLVDKIESGIGEFSIPVDNIKSFTRQGDCYIETNVKGGGSSIGGAILGGVIAGNTGAVIGSRKEITSETIKTDRRKTILEVEIDGELVYAIFGSECYEVFLQLIPHKELGIVNKNHMIEKQPNTQNDDIYIQIEKLADLKSKGILTEDEFIEKKKSLLEKI